MCDILCDMTLNDFITHHWPDWPQSRVAAEIGISRRYLLEILSGDKMPGRNAIAKIEKATKGKVPPAVWFTDAA